MLKKLVKIGWLKKDEYIQILIWNFNVGWKDVNKKIQLDLEQKMIYDD